MVVYAQQYHVRSVPENIYIPYVAQGGQLKKKKNLAEGVMGLQGKHLEGKRRLRCETLSCHLSKGARGKSRQPKTL